MQVVCDGLEVEREGFVKDHGGALCGPTAYGRAMPCLCRFPSRLMRSLRVPETMPNKIRTNTLQSPPPPPPPGSIAERIRVTGGRSSGFDYLRLVLALSVSLLIALP